MNINDSLEFLRSLPQIKTAAMAQVVHDKLDAAGLKIKAVAGDFHDEAQPVLSRTMESAHSARTMVEDIIARGFHIGKKDA